MLIVAGPLTHTGAACEAPDNVGFAFTLSNVMMLNVFAQVGELLVVDTPVILNTCPLFAKVSAALVKLALPLALLTTPATEGCDIPLIE